MILVQILMIMVINHCVNILNKDLVEIRYIKWFVGVKYFHFYCNELQNTLKKTNGYKLPCSKKCKGGSKIH